MNIQLDTEQILLNGDRFIKVNMTYYYCKLEISSMYVIYAIESQDLSDWSLVPSMPVCFYYKINNHFIIYILIIFIQNLPSIYHRIDLYPGYYVNDINARLVSIETNRPGILETTLHSTFKIPPNGFTYKDDYLTNQDSTSTTTTIHEIMNFNYSYTENNLLKVKIYINNLYTKF